MAPIRDEYPSRIASEPRISPRLDPVVYRDWSKAAPLSREAAAHYQEHGYLALTDVFDAAEIAFLQEEAASLHGGKRTLEPETTITEPGNGAVRSVFRIHAQSAAFKRLASDARLVRVAEFLLGDDVYIHQSRLNYKPGFQGKDFYWHSDFETWHVEDGMPRMRALSMSVLLTDNLAANSPTMFIAGSHHRYVACVGETPDNHYKESLKQQEYGVPDEQLITELAHAGGIAMPTGRAGTVVIFDCNILHGSNSNITPYPRSNAFIVYNSCSNRLVAPFGPARPRPEFIAAREDVRKVQALEGGLGRRAA